MSERAKSASVKKTENSKKLPIQYFPSAPIEEILSIVMSRGSWKPTTSEQRFLKLIARSTLRGESLSPEVLYRATESLVSRTIIVGEENIPTSGPTIFLANHKEGPLCGMWSYFVSYYKIYKARVDSEPSKRAPFIITQDNIVKKVRTPFGQKDVIVPFIGQFRRLFSKSLNWPIVGVPQFDSNRQIINNQKSGLLGVFRRILKGEAAIAYAQGTHRNDEEFPDKAGEFLSVIRKLCPNSQVVPVRSLLQNGEQPMLVFGESVNISNLPSKIDGEVDINRFWGETWQNN